MMTNLFSIFDPTTNIFNLSINWVSSILGLILIPYYFWIMPNRYNMFFNNILNKLNNEFKILIGFNNTNGTTLIFISLFVFILFNNVMGIFSYVFTSTSHLITSFTITLPLWLSFMLYGWINHSEHMFSHLIPQGTPAVLMPFMVVIETISNLIRPGTLAVRLTANMIAGHLLLTLLSNNGTVIGTKFISLLILVQIMLLTLETAVAIIQSYVISILSTLYSKEVY